MRSYLKVLIISMLGLILFIPSALADNAVKRVGGKQQVRYGLPRFPSRCIQQRVQLLSSAEVRMQMLYLVAPMAYQKNAPPLYTNKDNLSSETKTRLKELKTKTVIIVGGTPAVSANTANQIKALGISVKRISGSNRYDTATKVAKEMPAASKAVIANGFLYADAIVAIPYAAMNGYPILFTNQTDINSATAGAIKSKGIKSSIVAGGNREHKCLCL